MSAAEHWRKTMKEPKITTREDEFRDYEERDIRDGWPYSDRDGDGHPRRNAAYGAPEANLDQLEDKGIEVTDDVVLQNAEGVPLPFSDLTEDVVADDDLEDRITRALEDDERIDLTSLQITVRDGVALLEGTVDSADDRKHLIALMRAMRGVRDVNTNGLIARGVDSNIPGDADE
jgi:hypothetical protein